MDVAELVLKYLQTVIWPVTTLGLVWFLRAHLREALGRLTRLETPLGAADFEVDARRLRERADEFASSEPESELEPEPVPEPEAEPEPATTQEPSVPRLTARRWMSRLHDARLAAPASPVGAIAIAWNVVRSLADEVLPVALKGLPSQRISEMQRAGVPPKTLELFAELGALRHRATYRDAQITAEAALEYVDASWSVCSQLNSFASVH